LKWSAGNESVQALQRFFNPSLSINSMLDKVKEMMRVLPRRIRFVIRFACITELRPSEACESVRLINQLQFGSKLPASGKYYNPEAQTLEHFRFPDIFLRPTKKAYLSYLSTDNYQRICKIGPCTPYGKSQIDSLSTPLTQHQLLKDSEYSNIYYMTLY
jgi:hypothetical protein